MDYKEKYEQALERCKEEFNFNNLTYSHEEIKQKLKRVFPELEESEDEEIRKELIEKVGYIIPKYDEVDSEGNILPTHKKRIDKYIAWLEKQGMQNYNILQDAFDKSKKNYSLEEKSKASDYAESILPTSIMHGESEEEYKLHTIIEAAFIAGQGEQTPVDKVEPKFKVGDWVVVDDGRTGRIIECTKDFADVDLEFSCLSTRVNNIRSWTIQDAKDGDVLVDEKPFIFRKIDSNKRSYAYCGISVDDGFRVVSEGEFGEWTWMQDIKPATKEQRDFLFQKMKEAGYEWDAEKKELKKIEQKSAWSDEDENLLKLSLDNLTELMNRFGEKYGKVGDCIDWLKSLRQRLKGETK